MKKREEIRYEFEIYMRREKNILPTNVWKVRGANLSGISLLLFIFSFFIGFISIGIWYLQIINSNIIFSNEYKQSFLQLNFYNNKITNWDNNNYSIIDFSSQSTTLLNKLFITLIGEMMPITIIAFSFAIIVPIGVAICFININSTKVHDRSKKRLLSNAFIANLLLMIASSTFLYSFYNIYMESIYSVNILNFNFLSDILNSFVRAIIIYSFFLSFVLLFIVTYTLEGNILFSTLIITGITIFDIIQFFLTNNKIDFFANKWNVYTPIMPILISLIMYIVHANCINNTCLKNLFSENLFSIRTILLVLCYGLVGFIPVISLVMSHYIITQSQTKIILSNKIVGGNEILISINDISDSNLSVNELQNNDSVILLFQENIRMSIQLSLFDLILLIIFCGQLSNSIISYYFRINKMVDKVRKSFLWTSILELFIILMLFVTLFAFKLDYFFMFDINFSESELICIYLYGLFVTFSFSLSFLMGFLNYKRTMLYLILNALVNTFLSIILISLFILRKKDISIEHLGFYNVLIQDITSSFGLIILLFVIISIYKKLVVIKYFDTENKNIYKYSKAKYSGLIYKYISKNDKLLIKRNKFKKQNRYEKLEIINIKIDILRVKTQIKFTKYSMFDMRIKKSTFSKELFQTKKNELKVLSSYNKYLDYRYNVYSSKKYEKLEDKYIQKLNRIDILSELDSFDYDIPEQIGEKFIL